MSYGRIQCMVLQVWEPRSCATTANNIDLWAYSLLFRPPGLLSWSLKAVDPSTILLQVVRGAFWNSNNTNFIVFWLKLTATSDTRKGFGPRLNLGTSWNTVHWSMVSAQKAVFPAIIQTEVRGRALLDMVWGGVRWVGSTRRSIVGDVAALRDSDTEFSLIIKT